MTTTIRKAGTADAAGIRQLLLKYGEEGDLLIRPLEEILGNIRDYMVLSDGASGTAGVIALHVYKEGLAEIRSFVVTKSHRGRGYGKKLLDAAMKDAKALGIRKVFALTKIADFFRKEGFYTVPRGSLPQKIWKDCMGCPKFAHCDETAVVKKIQD